jgi:hypothetical protein
MRGQRSVVIPAAVAVAVLVLTAGAAAGLTAGARAGGARGAVAPARTPGDGASTPAATDAAQPPVPGPAAQPPATQTDPDAAAAAVAEPTAPPAAAALQDGALAAATGPSVAGSDVAGIDQAAIVPPWVSTPPPTLLFAESGRASVEASVEASGATSAPTGATPTNGAEGVGSIAPSSVVQEPAVAPSPPPETAGETSVLGPIGDFGAVLPRVAREVFSTPAGRSAVWVAGLLLAIVVFLLVHRRLDHRDPKLATAPVSGDLARFR